jgi:hypothetical protein
MSDTENANTGDATNAPAADAALAETKPTRSRRPKDAPRPTAEQMRDLIDDLTPEERATLRAQLDAACAADATDHVVLMREGQEDILVHPTCVAAHERAGWKAKD